MSPRNLLAAALIIAVLPACKKTDPLYCDENTPCTDPALPFCDLTGEYPASDGLAHTCIADPSPSADAGPDTLCEPNEFIECSDLDSAVYCNGDGSAEVTLDCGGPCDAEQDGCQCEADTSTCSDNVTVHCDGNGRPEEVENCPLGCHESGERCVDVDPSNDLAPYLDMTDDAPIVVLTDGAVIDTDAGTIENGDGQLVDVPDFQIAAPPQGVPIRLFAVKSITMGDTTVVGDRALAVVADGDISVNGHVRILAGAFDVGTCVGGNAQACTGQLEAIVCGGGGGGGFGRSGGEGGDATGNGVSSSGGSAGLSSGLSSLVPLRGGCRGGMSNLDGDPGMGGGAVQLVSRTTVVVDDAAGGFIDAGGGGGTVNYGGGSGGGILIEAPKVYVAADAGIVANGGGGGCYNDPGDPGTLTQSRSNGGTCSGAYSSGGDGAARSNTTAENGSSLSTGGAAVAGAGGGGVGRITVNVPAEVDFSEFGVVSPAAVTGTLTTR